MRGLHGFAVGILAVCLASPGTADQHESELMKEVAAFGDVLEQALVEDDVETMLSMYAEDAISLPNYGPRLDGLEAFRRHHEEMEAAGLEILSFSSQPADVWEAGDQVIEVGSYEIELRVPGMPEKVEDRGSYMTVYVRDDEGALKIKAEIWNTDVDPMAEGGHGMEHEVPMDADEASGEGS